MKTIVYLVLAIFMVTSVSAMTGTQPDGPCDMDGDGDIDSMDSALFDEVKGTMDLNDDGVTNLIDVGIFARNMRTPGWCFKTFNKPVEEEIIQKRSSGLSFSKVKKFLYGDFLAYLGTQFVTHEDLARTQAVIQYGEDREAAIIDCKVSAIMANKMNETYKYNGWVAKVGAKSCVKVNVI